MSDYLVTYINHPYEEEPELVCAPLKNLPKTILEELLMNLIYLIDEKPKKDILEKHGGFFLKSQIKEEEGYKFTNDDRLYYRGKYGGIENVKISEIPKKIGEIADRQIFALVDPPEAVEKMIQEYKLNQEKIKLEREQKKKEAKIRKAKKLLAELK